MAHANHKLHVCLFFSSWLLMIGWRLLGGRKGQCAEDDEEGHQLSPPPPCFGSSAGHSVKNHQKYLNLSSSWFPTSRHSKKNQRVFKEKERKKNRKNQWFWKINQENISGDLIFNPWSLCFCEKDKKSSCKLTLERRTIQVHQTV